MKLSPPFDLNDGAKKYVASMNASEHSLLFSVTLLLQWQTSAGSPPRIRCSCCVTCKRSSDPTSSSSPTSSAMQPDCSRLENTHHHTRLSQCLLVCIILYRSDGTICLLSSPPHRPVVFWASPPLWQSSTPKAWVPRCRSWEQRTCQRTLKLHSPWW